ncbi:MAG TPA: hypothetical protein CFH80_00705, partial [Sulfurospirillum cavolei]
FAVVNVRDYGNISKLLQKILLVILAFTSLNKTYVAGVVRRSNMSHYIILSLNLHVKLCYQCGMKIAC